MAAVAHNTSFQYQAGDRLGQYEIVRFIRRGGMAEVYHARHLGLEKSVAIKLLRREAVEVATIRKRFLREGQRSAQIHHPNIVDVTDVGEAELGGEAVPFLVMELLHGETLGERLEHEDRLPAQDAVDIMLPVLAGVWAGHNQGIVHRDLKPDNIFLAEQGKAKRVVPKVLDFGISRLIDEHETRLTLPDTVVGTPAYLAPEQARGDDADERADQFALATVLYRTVTGGLPRRGETVLKQLTSAARGEVIPPSHRYQAIDPAFEEVLLQALAASIDDRYPSLFEFARALLPFASASVADFWREEFSHIDTVGDEQRLSLLDEPVETMSAELPPRSRDDVEVLPRSGAFAVVDEETFRSADDTDRAPPTVLDRDSASSALHRPRLRWAMLGATLAALLGVLAWSSRSSAPQTAVAQSPVEFVVSVRVEPADATIHLDGVAMGQGSFTTAIAKDGERHTLVVRRDGFEVAELNFVDAPPPRVVRLIALAEHAPAPADPPEVEPPSVEADEAEDRSSSPSAPAPAETPGEEGATTRAEGASDERRWPGSTDNKDPWGP